MSHSATLPHEIRNQINTIRASVDDIQLNQLSQLSSISDQGSFDELTATIREELVRLDRNLDDAEILADECEEDPTRSSALQLVDQLRKEVRQIRLSFRNISLDVKRKIASTSLVSARNELLSGAKKPQQVDRSSNPDDAIMSASNDVAQSLRNTLDIMKQELDRSVVSTHMLEQQTMTLQLTSDQHTTFGDLLQTSRALINSLKRADLIDRILFSVAFSCFFLVCLYILKKRILDRGISLVSALLTPLARSNKQDIMTSFAPQDFPLGHATSLAATAVAKSAISLVTAVPTKAASHPLATPQPEKYAEVYTVYSLIAQLPHSPGPAVLVHDSSSQARPTQLPRRPSSPLPGTPEPDTSLPDAPSQVNVDVTIQAEQPENALGDLGYEQIEIVAQNTPSEDQPDNILSDSSYQQIESCTQDTPCEDQPDNGFSNSGYEQIELSAQETPSGDQSEIQSSDSAQTIVVSDEDAPIEKTDHLTSKLPRDEL